MDAGGSYGSASAISIRVLRSRRRMVRERPDLKQYEGRKLTVIAWLWARTVESPNPAFSDVERAASVDVHAVDEEGQGSVCRAGY